MLTTTQRKYLRALAHHLDPVVRIGQHGLTTGVAAETVRALASHDLIKASRTSNPPFFLLLIVIERLLWFSIVK